jgi:hypothetical protein
MGIFDSIKELIGGHLGDQAQNATEGLQNVAGDHLGGIGDSLGGIGDQLGNFGEGLGGGDEQQPE